MAALACLQPLQVPELAMGLEGLSSSAVQCWPWIERTAMRAPLSPPTAWGEGAAQEASPLAHSERIWWEQVHVGARLRWSPTLCRSHLSAR